MASQQNELAAAFALHQQGDLAGAERQYRSLLRAAPDNPDPLYLLGMLCLDTGRAGIAAGHFGDAVRAAAAQGRVVDPEWRLAHGSALQRDDKQQAALAVFDEVLAGDPNSVNGLFCRATALQALGRLDESIETSMGLLARAPDHAEAAYNLGILLRDTGRPALAALALRRTTLLDPEHADGQRAMEALGKTTTPARVSDIKLQIVLGRELVKLLLRSSRAGEAEATLTKLLKNFPEDLVLLSQFFFLRLSQGNYTEAKKYAVRALKIDPAFPPNHLNIAMAERYSGDKGRIADMEKLLAGNNVPPDGLVALHFALAGRYGSLENHRQSFTHYLAGNSAQRKILAKRGAGYDREAVDRSVDRTIANSPRDIFNGPVGSDSELPIFIVGMPRSGTTLIEQILASHPHIGAGGELSDINNAAGRLHDIQGSPDNQPDEGALRRIAAHYLGRLREIDPQALRVTDKLPGNYRNLGLIGRLFPNARVIHCRRNPIDNCLSCFLQNFGAEGLSWSSDFGDLVHRYKSYRRLMGHWRDAFPGRFLDIDYEQIVADQERQSRRLIEFAGLDWDDACLDFHKSERAVLTASHTQVREPIYKTSIGRWRRYGDAVAPLVEGLGEFLDEPEAAGGRSAT